MRGDDAGQGEGDVGKKEMTMKTWNATAKWTDGRTGEAVGNTYEGTLTERHDLQTDADALDWAKDGLIAANWGVGLDWYYLEGYCNWHMKVERDGTTHELELRGAFLNPL